MASSIKLVICGAAGRMGRTILDLALKDSSFSIAGLVESAKGPWVGKDLSGHRVSGELRDVVKAADVVIDFTLPAGAWANAGVVAAAGKAMVIGTTGFDASAKTGLAALGKKIPLVLSPNMSVGANLLFRHRRAIGKSITLLRCRNY